MTTPFCEIGMFEIEDIFLGLPSLIAKWALKVDSSKHGKIREVLPRSDEGILLTLSYYVKMQDTALNPWFLQMINVYKQFFQTAAR